MPDFYLLTAGEVALLTEVVRKVARLTDNTLSGDEVDGFLNQAPETYVALTGAFGVPALIPPNFPGRADCEIYQFIFDQYGTPSLEALGQIKFPVHNLSSEIIGAGTWILVHREKGGSWVVKDKLGTA